MIVMEGAVSRQLSALSEPKAPGTEPVLPTTGSRELTTALSPEVLRVPLGVLFPLFRQIVEREDGRDRTHGHAGAAVDAFHGIDIQHLFRRILVGVLLGMNAIHRTGVHTSGVFGSDAGLSNHVGHRISCSSGAGSVMEHMILARTRRSVQAAPISGIFSRPKSA